MQISTACEAIRSGVRLQFQYSGQDRVVEVHTVGFSKKNSPIMRAWQVRGGSQSRSPTPWRIFNLDDVRDAKMLAEKSEAPRPDYERGDRSIDRIVCEV